MRQIRRSTPGFGVISGRAPPWRRPAHRPFWGRGLHGRLRHRHRTSSSDYAGRNPPLDDLHRRTAAGAKKRRPGFRAGRRARCDLEDEVQQGNQALNRGQTTVSQFPTFHQTRDRPRFPSFQPSTVNPKIRPFFRLTDLVAAGRMEDVCGQPEKTPIFRVDRGPSDCYPFFCLSQNPSTANSERGFYCREKSVPTCRIIRRPPGDFSA